MEDIINLTPLQIADLVKYINKDLEKNKKIIVNKKMINTAIRLYNIGNLYDLYHTDEGEVER
jgi:hypothetical protein